MFIYGNTSYPPTPRKTGSNRLMNAKKAFNRIIKHVLNNYSLKKAFKAFIVTMKRDFMTNSKSHKIEKFIQGRTSEDITTLEWIRIKNGKKSPCSKSNSLKNNRHSVKFIRQWHSNMTAKSLTSFFWKITAELSLRSIKLIKHHLQQLLRSSSMTRSAYLRLF